METSETQNSGTQVSTISRDDRSEAWIVQLERPLVGFDVSRQFVLRSLGRDYEPYRVFASLDEPGLEFIVVQPGALFGDYVFEVPEIEVTMLGLDDAGDVEVLVLVTGRGVVTPTVNLVGPVIINKRTSRGAQIILQDDRYSVATPIDAVSACRGVAPVVVS